MAKLNRGFARAALSHEDNNTPAQLVDAIEYATKYATKAEKSSVSADAMINEADEDEDEDEDDTPDSQAIKKSMDRDDSSSELDPYAKASLEAMKQRNTRKKQEAVDKKKQKLCSKGHSWIAACCAQKACWLEACLAG